MSTENKADMLYPKANKLQTNGSEVTAVILDEELDPIHCKFNYDDCVEIDSSELTYISLSQDNLQTLSRLIKEAEEYFEDYDWDSEDEQKD